MILRQASAERLLVMKRTSLKAPWFIALSLGLLGTTPLLSGGIPTPPRIVAAALLFLAAGALFAYSRPRDEFTNVDLTKKLIAVNALSIPLERAQAFALRAGGHSMEDDAQRNRYRVDLVLDDGRSFPWLERSDPAGVLSDLRSALRYLPLPVQTGWGLPKGAEPWRPDRTAAVHQSRAPESMNVAGRPHQHELGAGICAVGGMLVIGAVTGISHGSRIQRGAETTLLSWILSGLLLGLVTLIAGFLLTDKVRVKTEGKSLTVERRALGLSLTRRSIPLTDVHGAYAVGPDPQAPLHVLVCQSDEISSIALVGEPARLVALAFAPAPASATSTSALDA